MRRVLSLCGSRKLALAGGCALNSLANGKLFERTGVEELFIQAAAGDAGTSLGAALYAHHVTFGRERSGFVMEHSSWGPSFDAEAVRAAVAAALPGSHGADGVYGEVDGRHRGERGGAGALRPPPRSPTARSWAGTRGARSGARARSATARSSPTRGAAT